MQVAKWGNSLAVRLPAELVRKLELKEGDQIEIIAADASRLQIAKNDARAEALAGLRALRGIVPADYRFHRADAYPDDSAGRDDG